MKNFGLIVFGFFVFISCRKEPTRWNSDWAAPIINDTLTLKNWINDSTFSANSSGFLDVNLKRNLFHFDLNSIVGIPDTTIVNYFSLPTSITIPPGYSFVDQTKEMKLKLNDLELTKIHLNNGAIVIEVKNPYPTKVFCSIKLPGVTKNGQIVSSELAVEAGSLSSPNSKSQRIELDGCQMNLTGNTGGSFNSFAYQVTVKSDPNGPSVQTTNAHITEVFATLSEIGLDYAKGYFGQQVISDTVETDVAILQKWVDGQIELPNLNLNLTLSNGIKAMARINIKELTTTKANGNSVSLFSPQINQVQNVNSATGSWASLNPSKTVYSFQTGTSNIKEFIENAGEKIKIIYDFELNPLGNISGSWNEIFPQSSVELNLDLTMPLGITLNNFTIADTFDLDFSKAQKQLQAAKNGIIEMQFSNSFPIQGEIILSFLDDNNVSIFHLSNNNYIESGLSGIQNLEGVPVKNSTVKWQLSEEDFSKLAKSKKMKLVSKFNTPSTTGIGNASVLIPEKSFLACKMLLNLTYQSKYE